MHRIDLLHSIWLTVAMFEIISPFKKVCLVLYPPPKPRSVTEVLLGTILHVVTQARRLHQLTESLEHTSL